jgi:hypothetical protein
MPAARLRWFNGRETTNRTEPDALCRASVLFSRFFRIEQVFPVFDERTVAQLIKPGALKDPKVVEALAQLYGDSPVGTKPEKKKKARHK